MLGGGGYVAGPVGLAARSLRLPLALTEADSHLGVANRLLAPLARRVFLSFPIDGRDGRQVRAHGAARCRAGTGAARPGRGARAGFELPADEPCVLVFGGSLGARRLNDAALDAFGPAAPCAILHACGRRDHDELPPRLDALGSPPHYRLLPYIEPFADALAAADLAVARAGGSVLELAAAGLPAVLVPYPHATADHQTAQRPLHGGAPARRWWCRTRSSTARAWRARRARCSARRQRLAAMAKAARAVARPDAAERIAAEAVLELVAAGLARAQAGRLRRAASAAERRARATAPSRT